MYLEMQINSKYIGSLFACRCDLLAKEHFQIHGENLAFSSIYCSSPLAQHNPLTDVPVSLFWPSHDY